MRVGPLLARTREVPLSVEARTAVVGAGVVLGDVGTDQLGFLLKLVVAAPEAVEDPNAGSLAGLLLAALVERGADEVVERHLSAGEASTTFEVRTYGVGSSVPVISQAEVTAARGVQLMLGQGEPRGGQELVAHRHDGTEARVVVRLGDGPLVYQFAAFPAVAPAPAAPAEAVAVAVAPSPVSGLADAVREALADTTVEVDLGGIEEVVARAVTNALPPPPAMAAMTAPVMMTAPVPAVTAGPGMASGDHRREVLLERLWLKIRGVSYQLRATGEALARLEAAVEQVDRPGTLPSDRVRDVVRGEAEGLRREVARLAAALSGFDGGEGLLAPGDSRRR